MREQNLNHLHRFAATGLLICVMALAALAFGQTPAQAHAQLTETMPSEGAALPADRVVTLTFNEQVSAADHAWELFDTSGERSEAIASATGNQAEVTLPESLAPGRYALSWRVVSADSHLVTGVLTFYWQEDTVEGSSGAVEAAAANDQGVGWTYAVTTLGNLLLYGGLLAMVGGVFFCLVLVPARVSPAIDRSEKKWSLVIGVAAASASAGWILQAIVVSRPETWVVNSAAIVLSVAVFVLRKRVVRKRLPWWSVIPLFLVAGISQVLVGHSSTALPAWLSVLSTLVHIAAGAVWIGGAIMVVAAVLANGTRAAWEVVEHSVWNLLARRFSMAAAISAAALAVTGTVLTVLIVPTPSALVSTAYGWLLLAKVAFALLAAGFGWWNHRLLAVWVWDRNDLQSIRSVLRRTLIVELGAFAVAVAATAMLTQLSPHGSAPSEQQQTSENTFDLALSDTVTTHIQITPLQVGKNEVLLRFDKLQPESSTAQQTAGEQSASESFPHRINDGQWHPAELPTLELSSIDGQFRMESTLQRDDNAQFMQAETDSDTKWAAGYRGSITVPFPGEWKLIVRANSDKFTQDVAEMDVRIP